MRIDKIEIDGFGKLNNFSITLTEGFNLIYGENESGKSTLCDFLLSMFYEMPNDGKRIELADSFRRKYKPWKGERFGGRVYFTHEGKRYLLEKSFGTTKRADRTRLLDADTWDECNVGENAGEHFFGLGREGFLKTLFLKGLGADAKEMNSEEILTRLSNMETSGDEDVSYIHIQNALEKEQHTILTKTGKGGKLYALKEQLQRLEMEKANAMRLHEQTKEDTKREAMLRQEAETLSATLTETEVNYQKALAHERWCAQKKTEETRAVLQKRLQQEQEKHKQLKERILQTEQDAQTYISQAELRDAKMLEKDLLILENKQEEAAQKEQTLIELSKEKGKRMKIGSALLSLVIVAISGVGAILVNTLALSVTIFAIGLVISVFLFIFLQKHNPHRAAQLAATEALTLFSAQLSEKQKQADALLLQYGAGDFNDFFARATKEHTATETKAQQEEQLLATEKEIHALDVALSDLPPIEETGQAQATSIYEGEPASVLAARLQQQKSKLAQLTTSHHALSIDLAKRGGTERTVPEIDSDMMAVSGQIAFYEKRYAALQKASEWLSRAHGEIKQNYAPRLNQKTAEIFSLLTREKYSGVKLGENFSLNYRNEHNEIVEAAHLSGGTYDLLYIALRFSALSVLFDGAIPPVILDDALMQLDDGRILDATDFLTTKEFGQVLYFTCHKSAMELFNKETINQISLSHTGGQNHELQN